MRESTKKSLNRTSWEVSEKWYDKLVGKEGHYYHQNIIIPRTVDLLELEETQDLSVLDLCCGQGILARSLPEGVSYTGVDASKGLIDAAKAHSKGRGHQFIHADVTASIKGVGKGSLFTHATCMLAIQNVERGDLLIENAARHLVSGGMFVLILNHPCFRVPRQSAWGEDAERQIQYRRIDAYMSTAEIPMQMNPSLGKKSPITYSFHRPLTTYFQWLNQVGFAVCGLEEWCSDKVSEGGKARMENRARREIPMFLAIKAIYLGD